MTIATLVGAGREIITVGPRTPVSEAVRRLAEKRIGAMPVLEDGTVVGIFSERDVLYALAEHGAKIGDGDRKAIEDALADLKEALKGDDSEAIKAKSSTLAQASMKLGEAMYTQQAEADAARDAAKDDVVDAEFTEVDDDKTDKKSA